MEELRAYRNKDFVYSDDSNSPPNKKYGKDFAEYNAELLKSGLGSDIIIYVKGKAFPLHRSIICARSIVFRSMFGPETKEGQTKRAEIDHYEIDVMMDLFEYIYSCKAPNIEVTAAELLGAADEYGLDDLKRTCAKCVLGKITNTTACMVFCLGKKHDLPELKSKSTEFKIEHIEDIPDKNINEVPIEGIRELFKTMTLRAKSSPLKKKRRTSNPDTVWLNKFLRKNDCTGFEN